MFQFDAGRTFIDVRPSDIAALYRSSNQVSVVLPGLPAAMAAAVIVGRSVPGGYEVAIALHLPEHGRHLVYAGTGGPLDGAGARLAARDAIAFAESMGFLMENVNWRQQPEEARGPLLAEMKVFAQPAPPPQAEPLARPADPRAGLARLLAQF